MNQRTELRQRLRQQANQKKLKQANPLPEQTLIQVQIVLALLPLLTACVYLLGMAWHMGYPIQ